MAMKITFKDIPKGFFRAQVTEIKEETGRWGPYLRIIFTITEKGLLYHYKFAGIVKPVPLRQSKLFRWANNILGQEPEERFSTEELIGKECLIYLSKNGNYYSVTDVSINRDVGV